jgi:hypothetical protein
VAVVMKGGLPWLAERMQQRILGTGSAGAIGEAVCAAP